MGENELTWNTTSFSRTFATIALVFMIMTSTGLYGSVSFAASVDSLNLVGHFTNGGPSVALNSKGRCYLATGYIQPNLPL